MLFHLPITDRETAMREFHFMHDTLRWREILYVSCAWSSVVRFCGLAQCSIGCHHLHLFDRTNILYPNWIIPLTKQMKRFIVTTTFTDEQCFFFASYASITCLPSSKCNSYYFKTGERWSGSHKFALHASPRTEWVQSIQKYFLEHWFCTPSLIIVSIA